MPFSRSRPLGTEERPGYRKARGGWLLRAWDISCDYPMSLARGQQSPPARLSTWSGDQLGGAVLGRPIQGHGAGRKARLGSGWARSQAARGEAQLPSGPLPRGSPSQPIAKPLYKARAAGSSFGSVLPAGHRQPLSAQPRQVPPWVGVRVGSRAGPRGCRRLAQLGKQPCMYVSLLPRPPAGGSVCRKVDLVSGSPFHL